jgi:methanogenic corrinoid protein MtbC1
MTKAIDSGENWRRIGSDVLEFVESHHIGRLQRYRKGSVLYWQGDPVEHIFVVKKGAVKVSSISRQGKAYTHGIVGAGRLVGAAAYLLGGEQDAMAEALEDTDVLVIPPSEFERVLSNDPGFSAIVMRELAWGAHRLSDKARDLSFLDVQQRLKHTLMRLAEEHGLATENGVRIELSITHEEMGELVAANRTTITACLRDLKREGYLWTEGRRLVIIPPEHMQILDSLSQSVAEGDDQGAIHWARRAVQVGVDPVKALNALTSGMKRVDRGFTRSEIDLPDVVLSAFALKDAIPIVEREVQGTGKRASALGTVVIGTVLGDIHDIGKTLVAMLLKARGFRVIDLGVNVPTDRFVWGIRKYRPDVLAMSALTTVSAPKQGEVIQALQEKGLRDRVKIMVGGGAVTQKLAERIGADGYGFNAGSAAELAWRLCTWT